MIACISVLAFALQLVNDPLNTLLGRVTEFEVQYAFIPAVAHDEPWRWVTGPFLHVAPWHLLNNVGFLLILGTWLEEDVGSLRLAALFVAGALAGEAVNVFAGDEMDLVLGISGGLMAIGGAAVVAERGAVFADYRQRLAGLSIGLTLLLNLGAPAFGSLGGHLAGAIAGAAIGLVLPASTRARARQVADSEKARAEWLEAKAAVRPASPDEAVYTLRATRARTLWASLIAVIIVLTGVSMGLQSVFISDTTSGTVAVIAGLWTVGAGWLYLARTQSSATRFDVTGISGRRWKQSVQWSEVESLYPGRMYSGLLAISAVGMVRRDGKTFSIPSVGHSVRPLALKLESIRLAGTKTD